MPLAPVAFQAFLSLALAAIGLRLVIGRQEAAARLCGGGLLALAIGLAADIALAWMDGGAMGQVAGAPPRLVPPLP